MSDGATDKQVSYLLTLANPQVRHPGEVPVPDPR